MQTKMDAHIHTYTLHARHSSLLFSVDDGSHAGRRGKGQGLDVRREGSAPLPPVEWDLRPLEREPTKLSDKRRKKETAVIKEDFNCFKEGERKKAQKSNTSKGTMNVELNGTKPFLWLKLSFFFLYVFWRWL